DADLNAQTLYLPNMDVRVAGAQVSGTLRGTKIVDAPNISGSVQLANTSLRDLLEKFDIKLPATRDAAVFKVFSFSATLAANSKPEMLPAWKRRLADPPAGGRAGTSHPATTAPPSDPQVDNANAALSPAPVPPAPEKAKATAAPSAPTPIPVELLR